MNRIASTLLLVLTSLTSLALAAASCYAQNNVIYACITKTTGGIRIVSTASQCKSNEASIFWNVTGPEGQQGPQGPAAGVCSDSATKTYLLFPFVINQNGFDTAIEIANTGKDPSGSSGQDGTIVLNFYGPGAPAPITTSSLAQGDIYSNLISSLQGGFQGYIIATCNFPFAHGFTFVSDVGARNLATSYLATTICIPRVPPR